MIQGIEPIEIKTVSPCFSISLSPNDLYLLCGHADSVLRVFEVPISQLEIKSVKEIPMNKSAITSIVFSENTPNTMILNTKDSRIIMMDSQTFKPEKIFEKLSDYIYPSQV